MPATDCRSLFLNCTTGSPGAVAGDQDRRQLAHHGRPCVGQGFHPVVVLEPREEEVETFLQARRDADRLGEVVLVGHVAHADEE